MSELDGGFAENATHILPLRVYYEDTDAGGIVYHASYLRFMERGRTAMLRLSGWPLGALFEEEGVMFAVRRMTIDFLAPARLEDALEVETRITDIGGASLKAEQRVLRDKRALATAGVVLAAVGGDGRAVRLPGSLRDALRARFSRFDTRETI